MSSQSAAAKQLSSDLFLCLPLTGFLLCSPTYDYVLIQLAVFINWTLGALQLEKNECSSIPKLGFVSQLPFHINFVNCISTHTTTNIIW